MILGIEGGANYTTFTVKEEASGPSLYGSTGSAGGAWGGYAPVIESSTASGPGYQFGLFLRTSRDADLAAEMVVHYSLRNLSVETDNTVTTSTERISSVYTTTTAFRNLELSELFSLRLDPRWTMLLGGGVTWPLHREDDVVERRTVVQLATDLVTGSVHETQRSVQVDLTPAWLSAQAGLRYHFRSGIVLCARYSFDVKEFPAQDNITERFGVLRFSVGYCLLGRSRVPKVPAER